tara:strand:- start:148 stop:303 length:156 start_codon:yes stop_codon:yes gene_type:complete
MLSPFILALFSALTVSFNNKAMLLKANATDILVILTAAMVKGISIEEFAGT